MFERSRTITNPRQRDKDTCNKLAKVSTSCWVARWIPTEEIAVQGVQGLAIAMCMCVPTADDRRRNILEHVTSLNRMEWWNDGMMGWLIISLMPCKQISVLRGPWHTTLQLPGPKLPWFDEAQPCYEESGILLIRICKMCVYTHIHYIFIDTCIIYIIFASVFEWFCFIFSEDLEHVWRLHMHLGKRLSKQFFPMIFRDFLVEKQI